jgi:arsenic resistance protein ArsH
VDVMEELVKITVLLSPHHESGLLGDRYSEREEKREHGRLRSQEEARREKEEKEKEEREKEEEMATMRK